MKTILLLALLTAVFAAAKIPLERRLGSSRADNLAQALDPRERIGQTAFIGALGGFRDVVADFLFIDAHFAWERTDWPYLLMRFRQVTTLQPHVLMFWDIAAWHMAWNAGTAALNDETKSPVARRRLQRQYLDLGRDFLERGIANNPNRAELYEAMARLYRDKYHDHLRAADYFEEASKRTGAAAYDERFSAYELSYCPGQEREAYQRLHDLYLRGEKERLSTLLARLRILENKLNIPATERIPPNDK